MADFDSVLGAVCALYLRPGFELRVDPEFDLNLGIDYGHDQDLVLETDSYLFPPSYQFVQMDCN